MEQITIEQMNEKFNELNEKFEKLKEDLIFSRRIRDAWDSYDRGEFISQNSDEFLEELEKC